MEGTTDAAVAVHGDDDEDAVGGDVAEERQEAQQTTREVGSEGEVEAKIGNLRRHGDEADDEVADGQADDEEVLSSGPEPHPIHVHSECVSGNSHYHRDGHVHHRRDHRARESIVFKPEVPGCEVGGSLVLERW